MGDASNLAGKGRNQHASDGVEGVEGHRGSTSSAPHISSSHAYPPYGGQDGAMPFHSQLPPISAQQYNPDGQRMQSQPRPATYNLPHMQQQQPELALNMGAMAGALPDEGMHLPSGSHSKHQFSPPLQRSANAAASAANYQMQPGMAYPISPTAGYQNHTTYGSYGPNQYPAVFPQQAVPQQPMYGSFNPMTTRINTIQQPVGAYQQVPPQFYYMPGGFGGQVPQSSYNTQYGPAYAGRMGHQGDQGIRRQSSESSLSAIPRGPPRKPKQSGHALWVGNLPPGATILDLKDHFSRDATHDIESLFLISKSNCAFVNYRTEPACAAAMQRFHDSRFQGVRLVCRLRRSSTAAPGVPTGPASSTSAIHRGASQVSLSRSSVDESGGEGDVDADGGSDEESAEPKSQQETQSQQQTTGSGSQRAAEKFFIIKSLTLQDLEQSVRNGIWATQAHNEEILNVAFESADNIYLIFSANKSGEYFGYARMISPISGDATQVYNTIPPVQHVETTNAPRTIPTPATETAPKGRIIDDSSRGTIFWEAELTDEEEVDEVTPAPTAIESKNDETGSSSPSTQAYGKPFKVEWMSTNRLPFYRTRGLRNPWNANRDVKIARDGTELEPTVGRKLVQLFHRAVPSPAEMGGGAGQMPAFTGGPAFGQPHYGA